MNDAGTEVTCRVQAGAGWATQAGNQCCDQEPEAEVRNPNVISEERRLRDTECTQNQDVGTEEFVQEAVQLALGGVDCAERPQNVLRVGRQVVVRLVGGNHDELADHGTRELDENVWQYVTPWEEARNGEAEGERWVDVVTRDGTEHECWNQDPAAVTDRDKHPVRAVTLGPFQIDVGNGTVTKNNHDGSPNEFGR